MLWWSVAAEAWNQISHRELSTFRRPMHGPSPCAPQASQRAPLLLSYTRHTHTQPTSDGEAQDLIDQIALRLVHGLLFRLLWLGVGRVNCTRPPQLRLVLRHVR